MSGRPATTRGARRWLLAAGACLALGLPAGRGDAAEGDDPYVGYLFPAGARAGTTVQVSAGGQNLRGVSEAIVSGTGVRARVIDLLPPWRPLDAATSRVVMRALAEARDAKVAEAAGKPPPPKREPPVELGPDGKPEKPPALPDHPLLRDLSQRTLPELRRIGEYFLKPRNLMQVKRAIAETARLEVVVEPGAAPGVRELRLVTAGGLTNPMRFDVGTLPEAMDTDPGDEGVPVAEPPIVWNGQILPKEVDRFRFRAREGQSLVVRVDARHLIPYQADSVPGWMQAVVTVYDADGREVAYADDWRYDPDPVLFFPVRKSGEYVLEVRDALYRGREDFVYRVTLSEQPFVATLFPLGGRAGSSWGARLSGWNLPFGRVLLAAASGLLGTRWADWTEGGVRTNPVPYAVDALPEMDETEPNDAVGTAQVVSLPLVVNGRIDKPGDVDWFRLYGNAGDEIVAEVQARRLGSPMDSLLRLVDEGGHVLAWNDDHDDVSMGLETHHADSYLRYKVPVNGRYFVRLSDAQGHGGEDHVYRLRLSRPQPDFTLVVTPASVNLRAGASTVVAVHAVRRDGYAGDVAMALAGAPAGFVLEGATLPAGRDEVRMTLRAPAKPPKEPFALSLVGRATIAGKVVERTAAPADDEMQAFAYRHLVPAQQWMATVRGGARPGPAVEVAQEGPVRIPAGGRGRAHLKVAGRGLPADVHLELQDPPKGITLEEVAAAADGVDLVLRADAKAFPGGYEDNLIVEVYAGTPPPRANSKTPKPLLQAPRRVLLGVLPAIPIKVGGG